MSAQPRGFVLISVLGVLLAAALVVGILAGGGLARSRSAQADLERLRLESAAESAAHMMLAQPPAALMQSGRAHVEWEIDGHRVEVWAQLGEGLVSLRTDSPDRDALLARVFGPDAAKVRVALDRLASQPGLVSGSQLAALPGIDEARLGQLHLHGSMFVEHPRPSARMMSPELRALLARRTEPEGGAVDPASSSLVGQWVKLRARAKRGEYASRFLLIEARLTGQRPQPVWVHDALWLSAPMLMSSNTGPGA